MLVSTLLDAQMMSANWRFVSPIPIQQELERKNEVLHHVAKKLYKDMTEKQAELDKMEDARDTVLLQMRLHVLRSCASAPQTNPTSSVWIQSCTVDVRPSE